MAAPITLPTLLTNLTDSLISASSSLPSPTTLAPPPDGISLLDTKNELLLSYLHNLVFLILLKIRQKSSSPDSTPPTEGPTPNNDAVTKKLVELRIYLEKGVRPLESRLKYQLDKLLLAASEASSTAQLQNGAAKTTNRDTRERRRIANSDTDAQPQPTIPDLAYRPNPSAFTRPSESKPTTHHSTTTTTPSDTVYRPPRITPTALPLPTTDSSSRTNNNNKTKDLKPRKSHTLNEFIREEMDDAPIAEPSIGAGNGLRGREREREEERRGYEEMRLVRLPEEKKGKGKDRRRRREEGEGFGEDLAGGLLGGLELEGVKGKRKRERERDGGGEGRVGEAWEKRVKRGVGRKRR